MSKRKLSLFISALSYLALLVLSLYAAANSWSKSDSSDTSGIYLVVFVIVLIGFPFVQIFLSKNFEIVGKHEVAEGIRQSIPVEIIVFFLLWFLLFASMNN